MRVHITYIHTYIHIYIYVSYALISVLILYLWYLGSENTKRYWNLHVFEMSSFNI